MRTMLIATMIWLSSTIVHVQTPPIQKPQAQAAAPQTPAAPVVSPEVHADHRVTFRLRAPNVKEVNVQIEGASKPLAMQKDDEGVWSGTTEPLAPDYYGYAFSVDGVTMFDPSNSATKPNFLFRASELHVPPAAANSGDSASPTKEVWLGRAVRRIKHGHAVDAKRIPVIVRSKRFRCAAPNALIVFLHRQWFTRTLDLHAHFFTIWRAKTERYPMIGMCLR